MIARLPVASLLGALVLLTACQKADESAGPQAPAAAAAPSSTLRSSELAAAPAQGTTLDLSAWGPQWKGYVTTVNAKTKATLETKPQRINLSAQDSVLVREAPHFEDGTKETLADKACSNVKVVSAGEVHYERTAPAGKEWHVDYLLKVGGEKWSCEVESATSAAMAEQLLQLCKSVRQQ